MSEKPQPVAADLSQFPDLTVVYLGLKITLWRGLRTVLGFGRPFADIARHKPDGLLHHETFLWRLDHVGIRQYWRDFDALERFTRSEPHKKWWSDFSKDQRGTGFWHETYRKAGGMEGLYVAMPSPTGFATFAPPRARTGAYATARRRLVQPETAVAIKPASPLAAG